MVMAAEDKHIFIYNKTNIFLPVVPVNLAQLVVTLNNLCKNRGSNPGHPT